MMASNEVGAVCFLETKTKDATKLLKMEKNMGFTKHHMVDPLGFAGRLLFLWRPEIFKFEVGYHTSQVIHGTVKDWGSRVTRVSFAYVRPNPMAKEMFWKDCLNYANSGTGPWILLGDFNDMARREE